jgi:hypothetical protein
VRESVLVRGRCERNAQRDASYDAATLRRVRGDQRPLRVLQVSGAVQHELLNKNLLYRCLDCVVQVPPPLLRRRRQQCAL